MYLQRGHVPVRTGSAASKTVLSFETPFTCMRSGERESLIAGKILEFGAVIGLFLVIRGRREFFGIQMA